MIYSNNDVGIVGYGAVLADAPNPEAFWANVVAGACSIKPIPDDRWSKSLYFDNDANVEDKTVSNLAGYVDESIIDDIATKFNLSRSSTSRLQMMALEATDQALTRPDISSIPKGRIAIYLGCMDQDEAIRRQVFLADEGSDIRKHLAETAELDAESVFSHVKEHFAWSDSEPDTVVANLITSSILDAIKSRYGFKGVSGLIDAACASSLAAIDIAMKSLQTYESDFILAGGMEGNIGPETFVLFTKVGAASDEPCRPFDKNSKGLNQGEGAVVFALQRLEDAKRCGNEIFGVLRGCGASSDGRSGSLFEPTVAGQTRAYKQAYQKAARNAVVYVEAHATGTAVGDRTELNSLTEYFGDRSIPIGSVKALIGHTKGAAGAVSLLKCLLAMTNQVIPPSPYFQTFPDDVKTSLKVNGKALPLEKNGNHSAFGASSFGFGGINYHVVLETYDKSGTKPTSVSETGEAEEQVVLLGTRTRETAGIKESDTMRRFNIPPRSLPQIDDIQIAAIVAVAELARELGINFESLDRDRISVISAGTLGLSASRAMSMRVTYFEFREIFGDELAQHVPNFLNLKRKYADITEDSGPGVLNNVIAGRIANTFDFRGRNFNVESELKSLPFALKVAKLHLSVDISMVVLVASHDELNRMCLRIDRPRLSCYFLASLSYAKEFNLPIEATLDDVSYTE